MAFADNFPESWGSIAIDRHSPESLAQLDYAVELELKNKALAAETAAVIPAERLAPVHPSPLARNWRTTSKRRVSCRGREVFLHMGRKPGKEKVFLSPLEPDIHNRIYAFVHKMLVSCCRKLAPVMNYCIIRGSYQEHVVIFNMRELSGDVVRHLRTLSNRLTADFPAVRSTFIYLDETGSDYYLEAERPQGKVSFKKICGSDFLALRLCGKKILYSPAVFSQINESILEDFRNVLTAEMALDDKTTLIDLYCGYGLWSLICGENAGKVWGGELSAAAVADAVRNSGFHFKGRNFHYEALSINQETLRRRLPAPQGREIVLLDPPRNGCAPGVLETVISRRPEKILIMFCGADEIVPALKICLANGCRVEKLLPFDFFPGTVNVETLAVLTPPV